jgi:crotonobetainyl-CoA:carnitine CoA-transferase CaiB-like acyl-CoA transferase
MDAVDEIVGGFTQRFDKQSLFELLLRHRVPCAPVRDLDEVVNDPHMHARGALHWIQHPDLGRIPVPGSPMRYEGSPPRAIVPSRRLGEDNRAVYQDWLGLPPAQLAALEQEGVV